MPTPTLPAQMPVNSRPSFLQAIKEGLAFGVGSSIGHRLVSAVSGEPTPRVSISPKQTKLEEYEQCMKKYDDVTCERILEAKN